ncbi:hypothetical protein [Dokdonia sp.]|uniref:hypothetical protein n=1 Tax=Dokdonia sp. TaxID=2024995 RepID=UPI0032666BF0
MNNTPQLMLDASGFIKENATQGNFQGTLNQDIIGDRVRLVPHTLHIRQNITGASSTYPLLESKTDFVKGVVNIQNRKFDTDEVFVANGIRVGYSAAAVDANPGSLNYSTALPGTLRNGTLIIRQSNREILRLPIADLTARGIKQSPEEYYKPLPGFIYFVNGQRFEIEIEFPEDLVLAEGAVAASSNHFFEIMIGGQITRLKSK